LDAIEVSRISESQKVVPSVDSLSMATPDFRTNERENRREEAGNPAGRSLRKAFEKTSDAALTGEYSLL
jgi:hypothetical protein